MPIWDDFVRDSLMQRRWIIAGIIVTIAVIAAAALVIAFPCGRPRRRKPRLPQRRESLRPAVPVRFIFLFRVFKFRCCNCYPTLGFENLI
jgi:hypothetical protein